MKTFNNEIIIQQGESFTMDKYIENMDGSPYIISNQLKNPYFLLTVSTSKYAQSNRYIKNYWLSLKDFPRFYLTKPVDLQSIKTGPNVSTPAYSDFPNGLPNGYIDGAYVEFDKADDAVFYLTDASGKRVYKYWCTEKDINGNEIGWTNYRCRLIKSFTSKDTEEWVPQSYVYSIRLVSGSAAKSGDKPLSKFDNAIDILPPTKLSVLTNI